jgi:hypothetical protein
LEGSPEYNGGEAQYSEGRMSRRIARLKPRIWLARRIDAVIAHAAPRFCPHAYKLCDKPIGVGNRCPYVTDSTTGKPRICEDATDNAHRGFECYRGLILEHRPRVFLHGHRHRTYGVGKRELRIGETRVIDTYGHVIIDL